MSGGLRDQIYNELNLRETEDLLDIWHTNDREEWSDMAFEVIKEILTARLGEIPPQEETTYTTDAHETSGVDINEGLEEWEVKALDAEDQPDFYDTLEVITLKENIDRTLKVVIVVNLLIGLAQFTWYRSLVSAYVPNRYDLSFAVNIIAVLIDAFGVGLQMAIMYYPLKALMNILRILMEMEFRSRKVVKFISE